MQHCNPCKTPVDTESKLGSDGDPVSDPTLYRSLAGALQYLTFTRPDISFVVQQICLYMHDPRDPHFTALKRILRYVRGTIDHGLQLHVSSTSQLTAYTDADWTAFGYCVFLGDNLLSWSAKRQVTLSRSSAEAEYRGVANVVVETAWIQNLLLELHTLLSAATLFYCDNVSAVYLSTNPVQHQRTKDIEIDIHFVREYVAFEMGFEDKEKSGDEKDKNGNMKRNESEASLCETEDEGEDAEGNKIELGPQCTLKEQFEKDKDDESLRKWKEQLLGNVDINDVGGIVSFAETVCAC
ncbi:ribonuclease H-like domain-containing protein [Tanacetum coccineum]